MLFAMRFGEFSYSMHVQRRFASVQLCSARDMSSEIDTRPEVELV